ncbi:FtsW/RodA/SpoVE family cell cycle protein [Candidatus Wolfebacteria bacterium]|nr:FtsW/RodA/SpoVE family cell cycle protein [Candidatus Wolfebacteria bacterium]
MKKSLAGHHPDYVFLAGIFLLVFFGLLMLSSASSDLGKIKFNDTYYYLKHQVYFGLIIGVVGFFIAYFFHYRYLSKFSIPLLLLSIMGLILVFTPLGLRHGAASRWIDLGFASIQPAEFVKLSFILYLAAWLAPSAGRRGFRQTDFLAGYLPFLIISGIIGLLILLQPSTTTLLIIMTAGLITYFASGARLSYVFLTILLGIIGLGLIIAVSQDYRLGRITGYLSGQPQEGGYHLNQALIAIGSGKMWGVGFGESTSKFRFLPEPIGDSIFAVIAEELGFIGGILLLALFTFLIFRAFMIAKNSRDQFAKLAIIGFTSTIALQTFIHVAAISGIIPLTGVPLPFVSYGGTSLAVFLTMAGIIGNMSKYTD